MGATLGVSTHMYVVVFDGEVVMPRGLGLLSRGSILGRGIPLCTPAPSLVQ
jgi:hypothetical protein